MEAAGQRAVALSQFQLATELAVGRVDLDGPCPRDLPRLRFTGLSRFDRLRVLVVLVAQAVDDDMPHLGVFVVEWSCHRDEVGGLADRDCPKFSFKSEHRGGLSRQRRQGRIAVEAVRDGLSYSLQNVGLRLRIARGDREPDARLVQYGQSRCSFLPLLPLVFADSLRLGEVGERIVLVRLGSFQFRLVVEIHLHDHVGVCLLEPLDNTMGLAPTPDHRTKLMLGGKVEGTLVIVSCLCDENRLDLTRPHHGEGFQCGIDRRTLDVRGSGGK